MSKERTSQALMMQARKNFYKDGYLNDEDKENFEIVKTTVKIKYIGNGCEIRIFNNTIKQSGDLKGYLDKKSWDFMKSFNTDKELIVNVLTVKYNSRVWKERFTGGFYSFNPSRATYESALALLESK